MMGADEPCRLTPIRFDPKYRWYFVVDDINDRYARAMFHMDVALWTAEDDLRRLTPADQIRLT
jgi:hypothetical protein